MKLWLFGINDISSSLAATAQFSQFLHFIILGLHIWPLPTLSLQVLGGKYKIRMNFSKLI